MTVAGFALLAGCGFVDLPDDCTTAPAITAPDAPATSQGTVPTDADAPTSTSGVGTGGENHEPEAPTPIGSEIGDPSASPDTPGGSDTPGGATDDDNVQPGKEAKHDGAEPSVEGRDPEHHYYRDGDGDGLVCE